MPIIIDPQLLPAEIRAKYRVRNNSLCNPVLTDILNRINVEIGDTGTLTDFIPHIKIGRWGDDEESNEVFFSLRLIESEPGLPGIGFNGEQIIWQKGNIRLVIYDDPTNKCQKLEWSFLNKPATNQIQFQLQQNGLKFYQQKALNQELNPAEWDELTEIYAKRGQGQNIEELHRPENVVGSYAVYHATKGKINLRGDKEYRTGKAFHIYRPKLIDSNNWEVWGILTIDIQAGTYTIEIPTDFYNNAVYPIRANDTFGHDPESAGGSTYEGNTDYVLGTVYNCGASNSFVVTHIAWYNVEGSWDDGPQKLLLYDDDGGTSGNLEDYTAEVSGQPTNQYNEIAVEVGVGLSAQNYAICHWGEEYSLAYDTVAGGRRKALSYPDTTPDPIEWGDTPETEFSMYVVYVESGGTAHELYPEDTITLSDSPTKEMGIAKTDTITLSDAKTLGIGKSFGDTINMSDAEYAEVDKILADTINLSDVIGKGVGIELADQFNLSEAIGSEPGKVLEDTITLSELKDLLIGKNLADTMTLSEAIAKAFELNLSDSITMSDNIVAQIVGRLTLTLSDTITLSDNITIRVSQRYVLNLSDEIRLLDWASTRVGYHLTLRDLYWLSDNIKTMRNFTIALTPEQWKWVRSPRGNIRPR